MISKLIPIFYRNTNSCCVREAYFDRTRSHLGSKQRFIALASLALLGSIATSFKSHLCIWSLIA